MIAMRKALIAGLLPLLAASLAFASTANVGQAGPALQDTDPIQGPFVGEPVAPELSRAARDLPKATDGAAPAPPRRHNPLESEADQGRRGTWNRTNVPVDPLINASGNAPLLTPGLDLSFEGTGNPTGCGACSPPDTNGDAGPNHYIQIVNATKVAIYTKSGTLISGPFNLSTFWSTPPCNTNAGDPIALYDPLADRWLLSQFASPSNMCMAVSQTSDPNGSYYLYNFSVGSFPDYFKLGVWPDAYYMAANEATYTAYAFDRASMLAGSPATLQKFVGGTNFYLPSDLDGSTPPPSGAPDLFYTFKDNSFHGGSDRIEVREFHVDWVSPGNSSFTLVSILNIAPFTYTVCGFFNFNCVHQAGTTQTVDTVSEWPMFRFPYRNFGSYQALVGNFTVGGGLGESGAAIRWFELRNTGSGWTLYQEGTFDPGDGHDRFMGSIAMDKAGNIALGYSVSSSSLNPGIRYTTRLVGDALGTLQSEAILIAPSGSQTGSNRWGDYSAMAVDPSNDCSFWYTNEYYPTNSTNQWKTRVGVFTISSCLGGPTPTPTPIPPTLTNTPVPPTSTNTPIPPTLTNTATNTPLPPTVTNTPVPSTATNTPTNTPLPTMVTPTSTPTNTPLPTMVTPTSTPTNTPLGPTATFTNTPTLGPTFTSTTTNTPVPTATPSATGPSRPTRTPVPTGTTVRGTPTPTTTGPTSTPLPSSNTGLLSPHANAPVTSKSGDNNGFEVNPDNGQDDDGVFALDMNSGVNTITSCNGRGKDRHLYFDYNISLPSGAAIQGIEVRLDASVDSPSNAPKMCVELSWDGGATWTAAETTAFLTTTEASYIVGGATDTFGRAWQTGEFSNANFRVRITDVASSTARDFYLDWAAVNIYYVP